MAGKFVEQVGQVITPLLSVDGFELVMAEFVDRSRVLRLYIDSDGGVSLEDCTRVSRLVGDVLDSEGVADYINGGYTLEVSSPGLDRPLVKPEHFQRFVGSQARLTTKKPSDGRHRFTGEILAADSDGIRIGIEGEAWTISYDMIDKARLVPQF